MGPRYLLDTNICLYFLNKKLTENGFLLVGAAMDNRQVAISLVSQMELLGFAFPSSDEEDITKQFVADINILSLTDSIVRQTIVKRKEYKTKLPDAIIAATALNCGLVLITRNVSDFKSINNIEVLNPFDQ